MRKKEKNLKTLTIWPVARGSGVGEKGRLGGHFPKKADFLQKNIRGTLMYRDFLILAH